MWKRYEVRMEFLNRLCAGLPADMQVFRETIKARAPKYKPPGTKSIDEIAAQFAQDTLAVLPQSDQAAEEEEVDESVLHVFERRTIGSSAVLVVGTRTFRAHIKDCSQTLSSLYVGKVEKERSFAVKAKAALYYPPEVETVPILRDGEPPFAEPSGIVWDKPIRMQTQQGPRSALKSYEYVEGAVLIFPLLVMQTIGGKAVVSEADVKTIFQYGGVHGYGPERGDGMGRYVATITPLPE